MKNVLDISKPARNKVGADIALLLKLFVLLFVKTFYEITITC